MEQKGEVLNQLGIICDLMENINLRSEKKTITFELNKEEFDKIHELLIERKNGVVVLIKDKFTIQVGGVDIIFNKNSV